jgi:hypothetical protein
MIAHSITKLFTQDFRLSPSLSECFSAQFVFYALSGSLESRVIIAILKELPELDETMAHSAV